MTTVHITLYQRNFINSWYYDVAPDAIAALAASLNNEYQSASVQVKYEGEQETEVQVGGYGDLLNAIRLRSTAPGTGQHCLGHMIGESRNCDLLEDIRRGVSKLAFAPETIMPDSAHRKVCHNCGCGC